MFAPPYCLVLLTDVAAYIEANQYVPGIPSAAEVEKKGVPVGGAEAKLLEKFEELMLHMEKQAWEFEARIARLDVGK